MPRAQEVFDCKDGQELAPFDWQGANALLARVRAALASLAVAESAAYDATVFAEEAVLPTLFGDCDPVPRSKDARRVRARVRASLCACMGDQAGVGAWAVLLVGCGQREPLLSFHDFVVSLSLWFLPPEKEPKRKADRQSRE